MRNILRGLVAISLAGGVFLGSTALAQDPVRRVDVSFASGTSGASYNDSITGYDSVEYFLSASGGQHMRVEMSTSNASNYFNVWPPGGDTAIFVGSSSGDQFDGILPRSGEYRVQVFLMRNAARRNETANFTLKFAITGASAQPSTPPSTPQPDFADGDAGGPDWYVVRGVSAGDSLNVRAGPSTKDAILGQVGNGAKMRNLGCQGQGEARWCQVESADGRLRGWVSARFVAEGAAPTAPPSPQQSASQPAGDVPELFHRTTGEFEINFASGCGMLFNPAGDLITAGSSCSPEQSVRAAQAVAAYRREQGL